MTDNVIFSKGKSFLQIILLHCVRYVVSSIAVGKGRVYQEEGWVNLNMGYLNQSPVLWAPWLMTKATFFLLLIICLSSNCMFVLLWLEKGVCMKDLHCFVWSYYLKQTLFLPFCLFLGCVFFLQNAGWHLYCRCFLFVFRLCGGGWGVGGVGGGGVHFALLSYFWGKNEHFWTYTDTDMVLKPNTVLKVSAKM